MRSFAGPVNMPHVVPNAIGRLVRADVDVPRGCGDRGVVPWIAESPNTSSAAWRYRLGAPEPSRVGTALVAMG